MKKLLAFVFMIGFAGAAFAAGSCPSGYTLKDNVGIANEYTAVADDQPCPTGYNEVIDPDVLPYQDDHDDKGTYATYMCEVPEDGDNACDY